MIKLMLTLVLAVICNNVMAEWDKLVEDDEEALVVYVDPTTIHKNGNSVKMWVLSDYKEPQELAFLPLYMSIKSQYEFNCKEGQAKELYASYHAKNMGGGKVIYSDKIPENWSPVSPDSLDKELWKFACGQ